MRQRVKPLRYNAILDFLDKFCSHVAGYLNDTQKKTPKACFEENNYGDDNQVNP